MPVNPYRPKRHLPKPYWMVWSLGGVALLMYAVSFSWPPSFAIGLVLTIVCWIVNEGLSNPGPKLPMPPE